MLFQLVVLSAVALLSAAEVTIDDLPTPPTAVLTSETFEGRTQAATGATTGDWLVMFFAPWCGHCVKAKPDFEAFGKLWNEHRVNSALVDCTTDESVCRRFGVRGYPTILLFRRGVLYRHVGGRTTKDLVKFVTETSLQLQGEPVPRVPTLLDIVVQYAEIFKQDLEVLYDQYPTPFVGCATVLVLTIILFLYVLSRPLPQARPRPPVAPQQTAQGNKAPGQPAQGAKAAGKAGKRKDE